MEDKINILFVMITLNTALALACFIWILNQPYHFKKIAKRLIKNHHKPDNKKAKE